MATYVTGCSRLTPWSVNISYLIQLELFFNIEYVHMIPKEVWMGQDLAQFAILILCDDSCGCGEIWDYFATDADTSIDIVCEVDMN